MVCVHVCVSVHVCACGWSVRVQAVMAQTYVQVTICDTGVCVHVCVSVCALALVCVCGLCACGWCVRVHVVMALADVLVTVCDTGYWQFECAGNWRYNCFEIVILVPPICCTPVPSLPLPASERLPRWPPSPAAAPAAGSTGGLWLRRIFAPTAQR